MKFAACVLVCLVAFSARATVKSEILAALSILPNLAFFFTDNGNYLFDVNGTNFSLLSTSENFFGTNVTSIGAASYGTEEVGDIPETFFFYRRKVFVLKGQNLINLPYNLSFYYPEAPKKADAAFPVVNGDRQVIGTNFILRRYIYECGLIGSACNSSLLMDYAQFTRTFRPRKILAALGLSNGVTVLFKKDAYAVIRKKHGPIEEFPALSFP